MNQLDKAKGCLIGLTIGDALGSTLEFSKIEALPWNPPLTGPHTQMVGKGPFNLLPGQVTDDTQMACCLTKALTSTRNAFHPEIKYLADLYVNWKEKAFDCGTLTGLSLYHYDKNKDPQNSGLLAWTEYDKKVAGNGALMRSAPIGVFVPDIFRPIMAISDALITHADPRCILANVLFTEAISQLIKNIPVNNIVKNIANILKDDKHIVHYTANKHIYKEENKILYESAIVDLLYDLILAQSDNPCLYMEKDAINEYDKHALSMNKTQIGFVRVAFRLTFWQLIHAKDFQSGLIDTVNRGGDTDTNGAIVGALLGAKFGYNSIPQEWIDAVLNCNPPNPWNDYHPKFLMNAVEQYYI